MSRLCECDAYEWTHELGAYHCEANKTKTSKLDDLFVDAGLPSSGADPVVRGLVQAIEAYIAERVETAEAKSFKNGFDEGVALHDQDVKCERERISHELKEIAWDDSKVRPGLKQVNLEFALEIVNKPLKSNERVR